MKPLATNKIRPVFRMRQLVFIGFFCGPLGLGLALRQSLRRTGESALGKTALLTGLVIFAIEVALLTIAPVNAIYFHFASGVMGKLAFDRWLMRPAIRFEKSGGYFAGTYELLLFMVVFSIVPIALVMGLMALPT